MQKSNPAIDAKSSVSSRVRHIDGLRGVAILAVVGYHVGLPGLSNGFVGVDIFFVISGFLIINIITGEIEKGNFSFGDFYARRTLRIIPPFILVILSCLLIAMFVLVSPRELDWFGLSAGLGSIFGSNFYFLFKQDYFDVGMYEKVLLHTGHYQ